MTKTYPYPDLILRHNREGTGGFVYEEFSVSVLVDGVLYEDTIEKDFFTDITTSPWWSWSLIPRFGKYSIASVVHDHLLKNKMFTRKIADKIFREMMIQLEVAPWRVWLMYRAVRIKGSLKKYKY